MTASDVAECSSVALGFFRSGGSDGGKEFLGKSVVGLIFCLSDVILPFSIDYG